MYLFILAVHNILRWIVLVLGIWAIVRAVYGWLGNREWTQADRRLGIFFTSALDTQLLLGLILYVFLSPITKSAFQDFGAAMSDQVARFFVLEHSFYMLLGVVFAHLGSALPKRVTDPKIKHQRAAISFLLAAMLISLGMPWMRPLFPGL